MMKEPQKTLDTLYSALVSLSSREECARFLEDLCTIPELHSLAQRFTVARLLHEGKTFNEIMTEVGASSATISRVNRALLYGSGGYREMLEKETSADGNEV